MPTERSTSAEEPTPTRRRGRLRRWLGRAALLLAALLLAALAWLLLWGAPVAGPWLADAAVAAARREGLELTVEQVVSDSWSDVQLRGVVLRDLDELRSLELASARVQLSPWRALREGLDAVLSVTLDGLVVDVDLGWPVPPAPAVDLSWLPAHLPPIALRDADLHLRLPDGEQLELTGLVAHVEPLAGSLDSARLRVMDGELDLRLDESRTWSGPLTLSATHHAGRVQLESLRLGSSGELIERGSGSLDLSGLPERLVVDLDGAVAGGRLLLDGTLEAGALELALQAEGLALERLAEAAQWLGAPAVPIAGRLDLAGRLAGPVDDPRALTAEFQVGLADGVLGARRLQAAAGTVTLADGVLRLASARVAAGRNVLEVHDLSLPIDAPGLVTAAGTLSIAVADLPALLAVFDDTLSLPDLPAEHALHLRLAVAGGVVQLLSGDALWKGGRIDLHGGRLAFADPGAPDLEHADLALSLGLDVDALAPLAELAGVEGFSGGVAGELELSLAAGLWAGQAALVGEQLVVAGTDLGHLELDARLSGLGLASFALDSLDALDLDVARCELAGDGHMLSASGGWDGATRSLYGAHVQLAVDDLARLLPAAGIAGGLQLMADVEGGLDDPRGRLTLRGSTLCSDGPLLDELWLDLTRDHGPLRIESITARREGVGLDGRGELASLDGTGAPDTLPVELRFSELDLQSQGPRLSLVGPARLEVWADRVVFDGWSWAGLPSPDAPPVGTLALSGGVNGLALSGAALADPERALAAAEWALDVDAKLPALAVWSSLLPAMVRRLDGQIDGRITLRGPLAVPALEGEARLSGGEFKLAADLPACSGVSGLVLLAPGSLELVELHGLMGGAPFELSGRVELPEDGDLDAAFAAPRFELSMRGERLLVLRRDGIKVRADADVTLTGQAGALRLAGTLAVVDTRIVKRLPLLDALRPGQGIAIQGGPLFSLVQPPLDSLAFDLHLTTKEPITFSDNLGSGKLRLDARLGGTGRVPLLLGSVFIEDALVTLPSGRLRIPSGTLRILPEDPFRPTIELAGHTRLRGYDIEATLRGPLDEPELTLNSSPPLPRDELLLLFLTGQTPASTTRQGARALAVFLAADTIGALFDDESTEAGEGVADRLELSFAEDVSRSGSETITVSYRITPDDGTGPVLYLTSEQDVRDDVNFGLRFVFRYR